MDEGGQVGLGEGEQAGLGKGRPARPMTDCAGAVWWARLGAGAVNQGEAEPCCALPDSPLLLQGQPPDRCKYWRSQRNLGPQLEWGHHGGHGVGRALGRAWLRAGLVPVSCRAFQA